MRKETDIMIKEFIADGIGCRMIIENSRTDFCQEFVTIKT